MRVIPWFIYFWLYLIALIPKHRKAVALRKAGHREAHDELVRSAVHPWAKSMLTTAGGQVTVTGLENLPKTPAVYVSNHLSHCDIPLMLGYLGDDTKPLVAKIETKKIPLIRGWMEELHCVFLHRDDPRAAIKDLDIAAQFVKEGYSMVIFPEGTRSKTGEMSDFKAGAFRIAQKTKVPVVPVCIRGTREVMRPGSIWMHKAPVKMQILPPIDTSGYEKADWRALPEVAEERVKGGLASMQLADPHH
ncbi:MAG: lysophospholipid acyltransferase family protein [Eubacterium aggregans]|uniref:lysophospholipid acyltransferase family protein n=1 Tax=Eubacterium aggregans TaxID=81409 RepID=UPI002B1FB6CE|nr:lysophospholipid acyltransferase family protein [Eubacterium aggregans]MEA5073613.1 lysophospholipid acyltransferase family protein [Eubacterium aggregans]